MRLNESQRTAIRHGEKPCLVLAGPGSGKTLTIVNRVQYLIESKQVRPEEILVITFTKYAATGMQNRFYELVKSRERGVNFGTFHGIYYHILKWAYRFTSDNIMAEREKYQLLREIVRQQALEIYEEEDFITDMVRDIGIVKNNMYDLDSYQPQGTTSAIFQGIYRQYEEMRKSIRKVDFDDMLILCHQLFESRHDVLEIWQKRFKYILIDEFQDINKVQYEVIKLLALPENNLFVVGDDDQSIYGFRGADTKLMFQFREDFPETKQILLDVNYRSTPNILQPALQVIAHNKVRFPKKIDTIKGEGSKIQLREYKDAQAESEALAIEIKEKIATGMIPEQIGVLFRIHSDGRTLVERLIARKIPFQMKEQLPNIYQHFIGRDISAYFQMALGSRSRKHYLQIMNRPKRYISRESLEQDEMTFEMLHDFYEDKEWMLEYLDQWEWDLDMMAKMAPYAAIIYLRKRVGYDEFLREYRAGGKEQVEEYFDLLQEIQERSKPFSTLAEWLAHVEDYTKTMEERERVYNPAPKGVRLMTIHASKGLEFETVYIITTNEGHIPYKKAMNQHLEEERRLFYVAMTRAKEELKISYLTEKNGKDLSPSRFIEELSQL